MRFLQQIRANISVVLELVSLITIAVVMNAPQVHAQGTSASVSGRVTDQSGGVVADAEVEVKDVDRGVATIVKTNGEGFYSLPSLIPGNYLMNVRKQGFQTVSVTGITLNIQDNLSRNFVLQVGSSAVSITVNASDIHLNTTDGSVSTVVDQTYVKNMPLNGRSFQDLILLTPGITTNSPQRVGGGAAIGQSGEFSVNGQRTEANYYTVDGVSVNVGAAAGTLMNQFSGASGSLGAATAFGSTQALVSVDDLQEFRVQSSTYSAEYGRNPGGQFAFETKSGTNQWHGTAYDYLRNDFFDANDWFNDYLQVKQPPTRQNDFGGTFGGPIRIPHLYNGKDKTFFFVSYEGLHLTQPQAATPIFVPDNALRAAAPTPLNQVLNAFPVQSANAPDDTVNGFSQFNGSWSNPSSLDSTSIRFDHVVNDKLRLFFRFSDTTSSSTVRQVDSPTMENLLAYTLRTYTSGVGSLFSNRLSNELRFNYSSNETVGNQVIDAFGGSTPANLAQLAGLDPSADMRMFFVKSDFSINLQMIQQKNSGTQKQWNVIDTVNLSLGRHQFKFGVDYRRLMPFASPTNPVLDYTYLGKDEVTSNSPISTDIRAFAPAHPLYTNFSTFAQDEWKVSRRLSLSLGLRWEVNPAPGVTQGLTPYTVQGSGPDTFALAPQGTPLWQTTLGNFAPRLGVAYILHDTPGRETVVRGGVGVFFDTGQQLGSLSFNGPGFRSALGPGPTSFPGNPSTMIPPIVNPPTGRFPSATGFAPHLQLPYTLQWNASLQQALGKAQALTVSYVGSHAARLLQQNQFTSSTNPLTRTFFIVQNGLTSDYDSLQVQLQRRLSRGLAALASYTWSHCLDYNSVNYLTGLQGYQRGNCDFDVRHNFSAAFSYDVPNVGHNGFASAVLHHWGLDDRFTARTAFPVSLNGGSFFDPATDQVKSTGVDLVSGQPIYLYGANCASVYNTLYGNTRSCPGGRAINPCAFVTAGKVPGPPCTTHGMGGAVLGLAPRNFVRGFAVWQMDLAVRRDFPIRENLKLQFRAEAFNVFNHPNFGIVNSGLGQNTFGQATGTLANSLGILSPLYQMGGPRSMQFALKLVF